MGVPARFLRAVMSSTVANPPEAMTGIVTASATAPTPAILAPSSVPSRPMSVTIRAATPASSKRLDSSMADRLEVSTQP